MDADERLVALKKAYADIILNTAKEAAARILSSERKAVRFQHELMEAKEEAVRMLLRLKQMMDFKINEAELTSLNQQRKIEELEAQLQEAEDIVNELRIELRETQAELERVTINKAQHVEEHCMRDELSHENGPYTAQPVVFRVPESHDGFIVASELKNENMSQRNECHNNSNKIFCRGYSYLGNIDLPSIILRSKEPELYRNGCTQRIRACERNAVDEEVSLSGKTDRARSNDIGREAEDGKEGCAITTNESDDMIEKRVNPKDYSLPANSPPQKRKRGSRYRKNRDLSSWTAYDQSQRKGEASDISCLTSPQSPNAEDGHSGQSASARPCILTDKAESITEPLFEENSEKDEQLEKSGGTEEKTSMGDKSIEIVVPSGEETKCIDSPRFQVGSMNSDKVNMPLLSSESKDVDAIDEIPSRVFKYTFQRKRKKEPLGSSSGDASLEISVSKERSEDKLVGPPEHENSSLMNESSRDSRRMAQVARQLISLSEKKWWQ